MSFLVVFQNKEDGKERFTRFVNKYQAELFIKGVNESDKFYHNPSLYEKVKKS